MHRLEKKIAGWSAERASEHPTEKNARHAFHRRGRRHGAGPRGAGRRRRRQRPARVLRSERCLFSHAPQAR